MKNYLKKSKFNYYYRNRLNFLKKYHIYYNESNLLTFQDKINWLVIHDTTELKGKCADKILLHEYSKKKLGKDICNKIIKIYNNVNQLNLDELPQKCVIKTNHGSGYNIFVTNKTLLNIIEVRKKLDNWIKIDFGLLNKEYHYSFIKRKIFVEEYIGDSLKNYKFLCYNGQPKYIYLSLKEGNNKYRNFYDMNWNFINIHCLSEPHPTYQYKKPKFFNLMKEYAKKLSSEFIFVRVDFYELENEVRLGELTFAPMNSFFKCKNITDEILLGQDIKIINKRMN